MIGAGIISFLYEYNISDEYIGHNCERFVLC